MPRMRGIGAVVGAGTLALVTGACPRVDEAAPPLELRLALPRSTDGVLLNEDLVFFFSAELDRASVTGESVRIEASDGTAARGDLSVDGNALRFTPAPVLARDRRDGGYRPATEYTVSIRGFPAVDGLRSTSGTMLARPLRRTFATVSLEDPDAIAFVDPLPERTAPLYFFPPPSGRDMLAQIGAFDSLYLDSDKPIDPASVRDGEFVFRSESDPAVLVPARARLLENDAKARVRPKSSRFVSVASEADWEREPRAALLELSPVTRLAPGGWKLTLERGRGPLDFSGHVLWRVSPLAPPRFVVGFRGPEAGGGLQSEEFLDRRLWSAVEVPGTDGTVYWGETGRAEVRYPRAAGDGSDGRVRLEGDVERGDVQAIALEVAPDARVRLAPAPGPVVWRAQGRLVVRGRVERDVALAPETVRAQAVDLTAVRDVPKRAQTLSAWLARAAEEGLSVTVLVAGGDLVVDSGAELRVDTPLLLVAGGVVRIRGTVRGPQDAGRPTVFVLGDGGGDITPAPAWADRLALDPVVEGNPLREELHYAILSGPIPQRGLADSWLWFEALGSPRGSAGASRWTLRFVSEFEGTPRGIDALAPVEDPRQLEGSPTIRMLLEMWLAPGPRFDVPFVDRVVVRYDPRRPRAGGGSGR